MVTDLRAPMMELIVFIGHDFGVSDGMLVVTFALTIISLDAWMDAIVFDGRFLAAKVVALLGQFTCRHADARSQTELNASPCGAPVG